MTERFQDREPTVFAAGILLMTRSPRRCLLMRHVDRWDLPKGHCEPGETTLACALRETYEETGVDPTLIEIDDDFRHTVVYQVFRNKTRSFELKQLDMFLGWVDEEFEPFLTEHIGYEWFDWSPPNAIQERTVDPLLHDVALYIQASGME